MPLLAGTRIKLRPKAYEEWGSLRNYNIAYGISTGDNYFGDTFFIFYDTYGNEVSEIGRWYLRNDEYSLMEPKSIEEWE